VPSRAPDVLGHAEVRRTLGVSRQGLDYLRAKHRDTFPRATELECGPVWARKAIEVWKAEHR